MEDLNLLAADGIVICFCCPCLILQFIVFVLLRLPKKLVKKSKRLVRKRLRKKKNKKKNEKKIMVIENDRFSDEKDRIPRIASNSYNDCGWVMQEVEKALTEFSQQGEFAFGSFWGRRDDSRRLQPDLERMEFAEVVQYCNLRERMVVAEELEALVELQSG
ncbi:uncharacterized protein LOC113306017 [Papaver somniferum]|uniref:uncharacterized protein LOC113306017 n=1 Tax=Papaver somniferum TaxID=3469 RepID=UPI000E6FEFEC|nr:uncharacterized protein LOC113306017 [Papaver somniferum]